MSIAAILTDIEGTTTDIAFVKETLFPYSREQLGPYLEKAWEQEEVQAIRKEIESESGKGELSLPETVELLQQWIDEDRKITPLKTLQGLIWEDGYRSGSLKGHLYPDAFRFLNRWKNEGMKLYVYSSGSVKAQQLLFGFSEFGDLTPLFSGYFDTKTGQKREEESYRKIQSEIGVPAGEILFLSDVEEELDAAKAAEMKTVLLCRDAEPESPRHPAAPDFESISF